MNLILLRASAIFLGLASLASLLVLDLPNVGFIESYLVGFLVAMLLWRARPVRYAQITGAVVQLWLGTLSVLFWPSFVDKGLGGAGVVLLALHISFAGFQLFAAAGPGVRAEAIKLRP